MPPANSSRGAQVSCVYVIGIIGAANYTTHYSVMMRVQEEERPVVMGESKAITGEIKENRPYYAMVSIHNPNVTKIVF
jgi:hypothetical protein